MDNSINMMSNYLIEHGYEHKICASNIGNYNYIELYSIDERVECMIVREGCCIRITFELYWTPSEFRSLNTWWKSGDRSIGKRFGEIGDMITELHDLGLIEKIGETIKG